MKNKFSYTIDKSYCYIHGNWHLFGCVLKLVTMDSEPPKKLFKFHTDFGLCVVCQEKNTRNSAKSIL